jgi:tRNA (guanine-N7-)-methyltransferase
MRKKKNLPQRMERAAGVLIKEPEEYRGKWLAAFPGHGELHAELGCGKGTFTAGTAAASPDVFLVAVEKVPDAMIMAMEKAVAAGLENVRFIDADAERLRDIFAPQELDRIYINFCDPWPTKRHAKRRLTSPGFLAIYKEVLKSGGEIHFKTDNLPLFEYSLEQFAECGFALHEVTRNLHENGPVGIMTDYEAKFHAEGLPINRCVAKLGE